MFDDLEEQKNPLPQPSASPIIPTEIKAEKEEKKVSAVVSAENNFPEIKHDVPEEEIHTMPMEYYLGDETVKATKGVFSKNKKEDPVSPEKKKKLLNIVIVFVLLLIVAGSTFLLIKSMNSQSSTEVVSRPPEIKIEAPVVVNSDDRSLVDNDGEEVLNDKDEEEEELVVKEKFDPAKIKKFSLSLMASLDTDRDGLTDNEEVVFGTNPDSNDTDGDIYKDKEEIKNFYSPISTGSVRLWEEDIISLYENNRYGYHFYYPSAWIVDPTIDEDPYDVLVSSSQNEFINIIVENKPAEQSLRAWYLSKIPSLTEDEIKEYRNYHKLTVIESPDAFTVYIESRDKRTVYMINYNIGLKEEASFISIFEMIVNSFNFLEPKSELKVEEQKDSPIIISDKDELPPVIID